MKTLAKYFGKAVLWAMAHPEIAAQMVSLIDQVKAAKAAQANKG